MLPLLALLLAFIGNVAAVEMVAEINMAGVKGSVTFTRNSSDASIALLNLTSSLNQYTTLEIHEFPAVFGRFMTANQTCYSLGTATQTISYNGVGTPSAVIAESAYFHRSLVLSSTTNTSLPKVCATILPNSVTSYRAKFFGSVAGTVWVRHLNTVGTIYYGDLYYSDGRATSDNRTLNQFASGTIDDTAEFGNRCTGLTSPKSISSVLVQSSTTVEGRFVAFRNDVTSFAGTLGISNNDVIESCATLRMVAAKTVKAQMNWNGVKGSFEFMQQSPFERTKTSITLTGLNSQASGYHVHIFPVPQRLSATGDQCAAAHVSGHFNPYGVEVSTSPASGVGTGDQYEVGDLSGKYGKLDGQNAFNNMFYDWNLPLWGPNSIVGRSMVIHKTDSSRWLCGTIGYPSTVTTGVVTFKSPVYGSMYFRQEANNPDADTTVFSELASQSKTSSSNHNWHVHVNPVGDDAYTETARCSSAAGHYNPSTVNVTNPQYKRECRAQDPFRCELGDLSGRLGTIGIATTLRTAGGKAFFTDEYLHLSGAFSVLGRSIVLHDPEAAAPRFACGNITQLHPIIAKTGSWVGTSDEVSGQLTMQQETEFDTAKVNGSLSGLANLASGYHIHQFTISSSAKPGSECDGSSVAGHYNPFNWTGSTAAAVGTYDQYEVGDLSNKYGLLDSQTDHTLPSNIEDTNLPLFTFQGSGDKSIVIHKKEGGERWKCSNLLNHPGPNGYVITATVKFSSAAKGTIKLRQIVYEDTGASPTTIDVDVSSLSGVTSLQHNWHIHVDPVTKEDDCSAAAGHYDPYGSIDNTDYATDCKQTNPLFCEVGDLSKKHAKYDIGGGRKAFQDVDVPLHTNYTVLGRSIVFHEANSGSPRYICANIVPDTFSYTLSFPSTTKFERYGFTKTISDALGISRTRIVILHNYDVPIIRSGCAKVLIHVAGGEFVPSASLESLVDGSLAGLGNYKPTSKCTSSKGVKALGEKSSSITATSSHMMLLLSVVSTIYSMAF